MWLVGESNPFGDPWYALWPEPKNCSGDRLCRALGHTPDEYVGTYERRNLLQLGAGERWPTKRARAAAAALLLEPGDEDAVVLCGANVAAAFGVSGLRFDVDHLPALRHLTRAPRPALTALVVPHPSGLSRPWNDRRMVPRVREAVAALREGRPPVTGNRPGRRPRHPELR